MGLPGSAVIIELDRPRRMRASLNALVRIEEECGKPIEEILVTDKSISMRDTRVLLWALLSDDDPELTIEQAGGLIDAINLPEISQKITETITKGNPNKPQKAATGGNARSRSTGRHSGPSDGSISDSATPSSGD